jgi:RNA polymerase sigma factor (sigma-70 family)
LAQTHITRTDAELWPDVIAGSADAWNELVKRYQPLVYAVSTRSGLSLADAADCFQQTWVALFEQRRRLRNPERLSAWLVTTAKREAIRLRRLAEREDREIDMREQASDGPLPDDEILALERQMQLELAIQELDPRCREVIELFFFAEESRTYEQIAAILGLSGNSLGACRHRCLERLKNILLRNGFVNARDDI